MANEEKKVRLKLLRPVRAIGETQDVGKTFEMYEKEAAALVGTGAAEYTGKGPQSADAQAIEKVVANPTRKRGSRSRGTASAKEVHAELSEGENG